MGASLFVSISQMYTSLMFCVIMTIKTEGITISFVAKIQKEG